ncbi:Dpf-4 [Aphelenchoides besseyi]|nr:Dpf-4 [Aphelenchoides besseyi]
MFDSVEIPPNAKSRVFVACLNTNLCTRKDVIELFSMYGQVVGVSHFAREGYAFVQFANESDSVDAVKNLHHWMFQGCVKIDTPHDLVNREPGQREQTRYSGYKDEYNYPQADDYNQQYAEDYDPYAHSSYQYDSNEQSADHLNGIPDFESADHLEYESCDYEQEEPQSQQLTFQPKKRVPLTAPKADFVQKKLDPTKRAISTAQNETGVVHENYGVIGYHILI